MNPSKPWYQSKTVILNILALASLMVPAVAQWVKNNPVEPLAVLGALNVLVRFVTSGKVTIFSDDDTSGNGSADMGVGGNNNTGGSKGAASGGDIAQRARFLSWLIVAACAAFLFPSCMNASSWAALGNAFDAKAVISHTDPKTGNSASVVIRPRRVVEQKSLRSALQWAEPKSFRWIPVYDPETALPKGYAKLWDPVIEPRPHRFCLP